LSRSFKASDGDGINAVLSEAVHNFGLLLRGRERLFRALM
jgi:hypothetical protein